MWLVALRPSAVPHRRCAGPLDDVSSGRLADVFLGFQGVAIVTRQKAARECSEWIGSEA